MIRMLDHLTRRRWWRFCPSWPKASPHHSTRQRPRARRIAGPHRRSTGLLYSTRQPGQRL